MDGSTSAPEQLAPTQPSAPPPGLRLDRIAVGLIVVGVGVAWFLDLAGVSVPWRLLPAIGLMLVGLLLLATLLGNSGRGGLIGLGVALAVVALIGASDVGSHAGPIGDRTVAPTRTDWPVDTTLGAGNLTIDLTEHPLPATGRLDANVGAGKIIVRRLSDARVRITAHVAVGEIKVNGRQMQNGTDVEWNDTSPTGPAVVLDLQVGTGAIEVHDE